MKPKTVYLGGMILFGLLSLVDLSLTWLVIRQSGGRIQEGNPIASAWLLRFGWPGLVLFKLVAIAVVYAAVLAIARRHPAMAAGVIIFSSLLVALVALYSQNLLNHPPQEPKAPAEVTPEQLPPDDLPRLTPIFRRGQKPANPAPVNQ
jgi:hypothetical protein